MVLNNAQAEAWALHKQHDQRNHGQYHHKNHNSTHKRTSVNTPLESLVTALVDFYYIQRHKTRYIQSTHHEMKTFRSTRKKSTKNNVNQVLLGEIQNQLFTQVPVLASSVAYWKTQY